MWYTLCSCDLYYSSLYPCLILVKAVLFWGKKCSFGYNNMSKRK